MPKLSSIAAAIVGAGLLQACMAPARQPLTVQPFQRVSQGAGQSAASWYQLGKYHHERGQHSLALGAYAQSLSLDGRQLDARNAAAALDAQQGRLDDARQALLQLVADYPGEAQPHNNLGYVYYLQGDYPAAIAMLRRALAMDAHARAYANLQLAERALREGAPAGAPLLAATAPPAAAGNEGPTVRDVAATAPQAVTAAPSRLELVELQPNVLELKLRTRPAAAPAVLPMAAAPAAPGPALPPAAARARLEVVNGNGQQGLARRYRLVLGRAGIEVDRIANQRPFRQQSTIIQYRPGAEAQAIRVQQALPEPATLQPSARLAGTELRLVLGKDAGASQGRLAAASNTGTAASNFNSL